ncbi:zonular occludens toxin domain protein [Acinetobacter sp. 1592897]|nr:zonular occludens toxin domain protein [Acinetobacter sp. 1592897]
MKKHGKYVAYTQQGTVLHDVSQSDCRKLIEDGDRPFITFKLKIIVLHLLITFLVMFLSSSLIITSLIKL